MNTDKIKKTLAGIGIAGLITGIGLMSAGCSKKAADDQTKKATADSTQTEAPADTTAQGSCGQGSCSQGSCGG